MAAFKGDKLIGKTNYIEWYRNASLFLELEINGDMCKKSRGGEGDRAHVT
jgi:translation elongation factor EF-1alpha